MGNLVAQTLHISLRKEDHACRMGGDEFAVALFFDVDTPDAVIRERVQQFFDKVSITLRGADGGTGISMGAAIAASDATFNQLYEASDRALYQVRKTAAAGLCFRKTVL